MHEDPNTNGYSIVLGAFIALIVVPQRLRLLFIIVTGVAVLITISRSAILLWVLAFILCLYCGLIGRNTIISYILGLSFILFLSFLLYSGKVPELLIAANLDQYLNEQMITRLSGDFTSQDDQSSSTRRELATNAWAMFSDSPIFGQGLGSTTPTQDTYGTHNMFALFGAELGTIGLFIYSSLILVPLYLRSKYGICFSHTIMSVGGVFAILIAIALSTNTAELNYVKETPLIHPRTKNRRKKRRRGAQRI
jgi:O-antigen ligase